MVSFLFSYKRNLLNWSFNFGCHCTSIALTTPGTRIASSVFLLNASSLKSSGTFPCPVEGIALGAVIWSRPEKPFKTATVTKGQGNTMDLNWLDIDVCNVHLHMLAIGLSLRTTKAGSTWRDHVLAQTCPLVRWFMPENEHLCLYSVNSLLVKRFVFLFSPLSLVIVDYSQ